MADMKKGYDDLIIINLYRCCSSHGWCGDTPDHCTCSGCIDNRGQGKF